VLNLDPALVNTEMVDILALPHDQRKALHDLISRFFEETGSQVAADLLADWDEAIHRISMVMPRDYARVLGAMQRAQEEGISSDTYVMEVANG
jgi:glutamate synthase (NADPH/NADH) large chain